MTAKPKRPTPGAAGGEAADPYLIAQIIDRAGSPGFERWWAQLAGSGYCASPVHLVSVDRTQPAQVMGRCKNRRAAVCPSCSALYAGDTWQLVHAGIVGGHHGLPTTVGSHPMVFATLTAPGFGAVHSLSRDPASGMPRPCHPSGAGDRCPHGRPARCSLVHDVADEDVGQPLCADCYDYVGHVLFTWHAPELWHRFTIRLRRLVAGRIAQLGEDPKTARVAYVKVVELQRRAVPHFHAVIRLDAATDSEDTPAPPDTSLTAVELAGLVAQAVRAVRLTVAGPAGNVALRFGSQTDIQPVRPTVDSTTEGDDDTEPGGLSGRRVAAYLAKYVTKSVGEFGLGARRISDQAIDVLPVTDHIRGLLRTITDVARLPDYHPMVCWLHTIGYRGHITSKTRQYSTTMGALLANREAWRQQYQQAQRPTCDRVEDTDTAEDEPAGWQFAGYGHANDGDRFLAISAAAQVAEMRQVAREEVAGAAEEPP
jgi:hypothetical protein